MRGKRTNAAFTLVELMIVVGLIGILATIAVPTFQGYKYKVRMSEARANLATLFKGEAALYQMGQSAASQGVGGQTGVSQTMAGGCSGPWVGGDLWTPTRKAVAYDFGEIENCRRLGFEVSGPTYFTYWAFNPPGFGGAANTPYINVAIQDLDGDGQLGMLTETVRIRNGELYRAGRTEKGDDDLTALLISAL